MKKVLSRVVVIFLAIMIPLTLLGMLIFALNAAEHYRRVYQDPLSVTASVTSHDSYEDSEGDTHYRSYISYTINGISYQNISFESKSSKNNLTPIGKTVRVDVSREDPTQLLSELKLSGLMLLVVVPIITISLSGAVGANICSKRTSDHRCTPDRETIQRDIHLTILGQPQNSFWLLVCIAYILLYLRYPMLLWPWVPVVGIVLGILGLFFVYRSRRRLQHVRNGEYVLMRDCLVDKSSHYDPDGPDTYTLHYRSGDKTWKYNTSKKHYEKAQIGDEVLAVYLPGEKKPVYHYDQSRTDCWP